MNKSHESHKLRSFLFSLIINLESALRSTHKRSESDERGAFASYLFKMQIYRQQDEVEYCKKGASRGSQATRSRGSECAVRPWYKGNHPQQDHLPQLRQHKSRRDRIKARVLAVSPSVQRYRALKRRVKKSKIRKHLTVPFAGTFNVEEDGDRRCTYDKDATKDVDDSSTVNLGRDSESIS